MAIKLHYRELGRRVKEIEKKAIERKHVEETLPESEERYRLLFEQSAIGIGLASPDGKVVSGNKGMEAITGYTIEELKEINLADIYENPEDRKALLEAVNRYGGVVDFPVRLKRKDGTPYDALLTLSRVHRPGGEDLFQTICVDITKQKQVERALKRAHDELECRLEERTAELKKANKELQAEITDRKQAEKTLRESEERFREMADLLPTIISELDMNYYLTYVNKAAFETFGYSQEDLKAINVVNMIHPDDREKALKNIKKVVQGKELEGIECSVFGKDGSELTVLVHSHPICKSGKIVGIRSTLTDITKIKRIEKALKERESELEIKTNSLEEVNAALRVLLKTRDEDKRELEKKVLVNVKELVFPFLEKLKSTRLDPEQLAYIHFLESNLNDIISPFLRTFSAKYSSLTATEIRVGNLIKDGARNKEMAELMNLGIRTIEFHRKNIRKKLGIKNKKTNLRSYLLSLQE